MLKAGDVAPDVELRDQSGTIIRLSDLLATGPVVLFFYPAALSTGCTAESCHFRDLGKEFANLGAQRLGISMDSVERQKEFADRHEFDYPLLSDSDGAVAEAYGVRRRLGPTAVRRATFVIGADGVVVEVIKSELRMDKHADDALEALRKHSPSP